MLRSVARERRRARTMPERSPRTSVTPALSIATSVPVPMAMPTFDAMTYHDAPLSAGKTYVYTIIAMNESGHSAPSNEVMVAIP